MAVVATRADSLRIEVASVEVEHLHAVGTIPGVAVLTAAGRNGPGSGRLSSEGDGTMLRWRAPGSATAGEAVPVGDGQYILEDGDDNDKWLRVQVYADQLLPSPTEGIVYLRDVYQSPVAQDDATASEAAAGDVTTYTLTLKNYNQTALSNVRVWIDPASTQIELSADAVTWYTPYTEAVALPLAEIAPAGTVTLHVRRTVPAAEPANTGILSHLCFAYDAI